MDNQEFEKWCAIFASVGVVERPARVDGVFALLAS